jgi:tetratricopeptide (TPR) repeat protein
MRGAVRRGLLLVAVIGILAAAGPAGLGQGPARDEPAARRKKAQAQLDAGNLAEAVRQYEQLLARARQTYGEDDARTATSLNDLGAAYERLAEYSKAQRLHERALAIQEARLGKDHPDVANSLDHLGFVAFEMGRYAKAEQLYERALSIREAKKGKDSPLVAQTCEDLADLYRARGDYAKAEPLYQRALQVREAQLGKDSVAVAQTLAGLGLLAKDMGQYAQAEARLKRALEIQEAKKGPNHPSVAAALSQLGGLYWAMRRYRQAEPLLRRALAIQEARLGKNHPAIATTLNELGLVYEDMHEYEKAEPFLRRSLAVREAGMGKNDPALASALNNLAIVCQNLGRDAEAEAYFRRSLKVAGPALGRDHPTQALRLANLARLTAARGEWAEAVDALDQARHIQRRHIAQVLPILSETEQLAFLHAKDQGSLQTALTFGLERRTDAGVAALSAGWLLNGKAVAQQALAERALLTRDSRDPKLAPLVRALVDVRGQLARLSVDGAAGTDAAQRQKRADLGRRERDLIRRIAEAGGASRSDPWVELDAVRKALPADAVFIDVARFNLYNLGARGKERRWRAPHYAAWVVPPAGRGDVQVLDLGPADVVETAVKAARKAVADAVGTGKAPGTILTQGEPDAEAQARVPLGQLARLVLRPLIKAAGDRTHWFLSPDADLWLVPWAALPLADGRYAVEQYCINYLVSGRDLVAAPARIRPSRAMVFADPDYDLGLDQAAAETLRLRQPALDLARRGLDAAISVPVANRLPATAAEAEAIRPRLRRYTGAEPAVYLRRQALEGVFKAAKSPRVVVLSTHGFFLEDQRHAPDAQARLANPLLRCGLLLAGANNHRDAARGREDDGVLTGLEIVGTDLRSTELVVLSACETGLGQVHTGEGVAGLRQAFQLAGARSVVASLWQVADRDTALLMSEFFDRLARGERDKAEALRQAQLARIRARRKKDGAAHPFFWAAFTLTGAPAGPAASHRSEAEAPPLATARAYHERGLEFLAQGRYDLAAADLAEVLRREPNNAGAHNDLGLVQEDQGDGDAALRSYSRALALDPKLAVAYRNRAEIYRQRKDLDRALADCGEAIRLLPNSPLAYLVRGDVYRTQGEIDRAFADYDKGLQLDPRSARGYAGRGWTLVMKGESDRALADLNRALQLTPEYAFALGSRGHVRRLKGDLAGAIADCTEAVRLDSDYAFAYRVRATAYKARHDYVRAIADWTDVIRLEPKAVYAYLERSDLYRFRNDGGRAIDDADTALRLDPRSARAHACRGAGYKLLKEYGTALRELNEALRLDAKYTFAYSVRGETYLAKGDLDRALADCTKAIELDPKHAITYLTRSRVYAAKGDPARASADRTRAKELDPTLNVGK